MKNLKQKTVKGVFWNALGKAGQLITNFTVHILLARLLLPKHFGLIAMLTIFIDVSKIFLSSGFGQSLIQKKKPVDIDYSTVFVYNLMVGLLFYIILFFIAPLISRFYDEPTLIPLTRFLASILIINAFSLVQNSIIMKKIDFKALSIINIGSMFFSGSIAVYMAFKGFGVWSLATNTVLYSLIHTILLNVKSNWKLSFKFSIDSFRELFSFGSKLLIGGLLGKIAQNIYNVIIGKAFSATALGYYNQAMKLQRLPSQNINAIIQGVTFPVLSSIQDDDARLKSAYQRILKILVFINFPLMIFLIAVSEPLIRLLLTEKWLPAVPYFRLVCIVGMLRPIQSLNINILKVKGRSGLILRLTIAKLIIAGIVISISIQWGVLFLVVGQVVISFIAYYINSYYSGLFINYGLWEQVKDVFPYAIFSSVTGLIIWGVSLFYDNGNILMLILQLITGIGIYFFLAYIFHLDAFKEAVLIFNEYKKKFNAGR